MIYKIEDLITFAQVDRVTQITINEWYEKHEEILNNIKNGSPYDKEKFLGSLEVASILMKGICIVANRNHLVA